MDGVWVADSGCEVLDSKIGGGEKWQNQDLPCSVEEAFKKELVELIAKEMAEEEMERNTVVDHNKKAARYIDMGPQDHGPQQIVPQIYSSSSSHLHKNSVGIAEENQCVETEVAAEDIFS